MYRLRERLHYKHVDDFLQDQTGGELAGDIAYLRVDDEVQMQRMTMAFMQALMRVGGMQPPAKEPEKKVIDTTDPAFLKNFKGFLKKPPQ